MRHGVPVLDIDRHVMEPMELWLNYLPNRWRRFAPEVRRFDNPAEPLSARLARLGQQALLPSPPVVAVQGKPIWRDMTERGYIEVGLQANSRREDLLNAQTAAGQLRAMDAAGVDFAVLLPTYAAYLAYDDEIEPELSRAYGDAYNRWLADECGPHRERLSGAALISRHDPARMVDDLERALAAGLEAVVLRPNPVLGRTLGHSDYAPFFAACAANHVPVLLHEGAHTRVATAGADRFRSHFAQHACSHPMEMMMGFLALLEAGVLERHPTLHVALLESGCGWLPYWLWRLDELEFAQLRSEVYPHIQRPPSEYFRRQCWIAFEPDEVLLAESARAIGESRLVFGSDFPHVDHQADVVGPLFGPQARLSEDAREQALWLGPASLMRLESSRFRPGEQYQRAKPA